MSMPVYLLTLLACNVCILLLGYLRRGRAPSRGHLWLTLGGIILLDVVLILSYTPTT